MTIKYGQGGYIGCSRSIRAVIAEENGELPLTRAVDHIHKQIKGYYKISKCQLKKWLLRMGRSSAHHTSKYANLTDFYDTSDIIGALMYGETGYGENYDILGCTYPSNEFLDLITPDFDDHLCPFLYDRPVALCCCGIVHIDKGQCPYCRKCLEPISKSEYDQQIESYRKTMHFIHV